MTTIRMDVEQARLTIEQLRAAHDELKEAFRVVNASVEQLEAAWEGQARRQFMDAWSTWLADLSERINALEPLTTGLVTERGQLIEADTTSQFG